MFRMNSPSFEFGGVTYEWAGMFGCVLRSKERYRTLGDVRFIAGYLFYAYIVSRDCHWLKSEIAWIPVEDFDMDWIRNFKRKLFSTEL